MDFLWRKVTEKEQESIKKEAKDILDKFSNALEKVEKQLEDVKGVKRDIQLREEGNVERTVGSSKEFRKAFLKNAPSTEDDFVVAEKGGWK